MPIVHESRRNAAGRSIRIHCDDATRELFWTSHSRDGQRDHHTLGDTHRAMAAYQEYADTLVGSEETDCSGEHAGIDYSVRRDLQTGADYRLTFVGGKLVDIEPAAKARRRAEFERSLS